MVCVLIIKFRRIQVVVWVSGSLTLVFVEVLVVKCLAMVSL